MYRRPAGQMVIEDFVLPFEGKLDANNRWVKLAKIIPWDRIEKNYADLFLSNVGTVAKLQSPRGLIDRTPPLWNDRFQIYTQGA